MCSKLFFLVSVVVLVGLLGSTFAGEWSDIAYIEGRYSRIYFDYVVSGDTGTFYCINDWMVNQDDPGTDDDGLLPEEFNRFNFTVGIDDPDYYEIRIYADGRGEVRVNGGPPEPNFPGFVSACCWTTSPSMPTTAHTIWEFSFQLQEKKWSQFGACDPVGPGIVVSPDPPEPPPIVTSGPSVFAHVIDGKFTNHPAACAPVPVPLRGYQEPVRDPFFDEYDGGVGWTLEFDAQNGGVTIKEINTMAASNPSPADGSECVPMDVVLSWTPGVNATMHHIFLHIDRDDVENRDISAYQGSQVSNSYNPGGLEECTTYYWAIDEANGPQIWPGDVWSFTTYCKWCHLKWSQPPIEIDPNSDTPTYCGWDEIAGGYEVDVNCLDYPGQSFGDINGDGVVDGKDIDILFDAYGTYYGDPDYNPCADLDHDGDVDIMDLMIMKENWGLEFDPPPENLWHMVADDFRCLGSMPVTSIHWWGSYLGWSEPYPPSPNTPIGWRIGFWSNVPADPNAEPDYSYPEQLLWQIDVDANRVQCEWVGYDEFRDRPSDTCFQYTLLLEPNEYFWQGYFDVNTVDDVFWLSIAAIHEGIEDYIVVDDFESYANNTELWNKWIDGAHGGNGTGSDIQLETGTVHGGVQSMKFVYANGSSPYYSEVARTFALPEDWAALDVCCLGVWFYGDPDNDVEQMYVVLDDGSGEGEVVYGLYGEDPADIQNEGWQLWCMDLQDFNGIDLSNVESISIGFGDRVNPVQGGSGFVYFDDIALYHGPGCVGEPSYWWGWKTRPWSWMDDAVRFELNGGPQPGMVLDPFSVEPIKDPTYGQSYDVAFELDTDPDWIKWEQPFTGIRNWPHYEDELSMAIVEEGTETKWEQRPDPCGWDVAFFSEYQGFNMHLADDWQCDQTGPVKGIHFWISSKNDGALNIQGCKVQIYSDDPCGPDGHSQPNDLLWQRTFDASEMTIGLDGTGDQDWIDPVLPGPWPSHQLFYRVVINDIDNPFIQQAGTIYWLHVMPYMGAGCDRLGWKTSQDHWNDDAVYYYWGWHELGDPNTSEPIDLAFVITTETEEPNIIRLVADDWPCDQNTPITAAMWWGSYIGYGYRACQAPLVDPRVRPDYFLLRIWDDVPAAKTKWTQLPDPCGWDVAFFTEYQGSEMFLADDWLCTETGPVSDICFWGSRKNDGGGIIGEVLVRIYSDDPCGPDGHSQPNDLLWQRTFDASEFSYRLDGNGDQGWLDPLVDPNGGWPNHHLYFRVDINDINDPFIQQAGTIYWLSVRPSLQPGGGDRLGWKTSQDHWNDDAVYAYFGYHELRDPCTGESLDLAFEITTGEAPYSHPNDIIWEYKAYDYDEVLVGYDKHPEVSGSAKAAAGVQGLESEPATVAQIRQEAMLASVNVPGGLQKSNLGDERPLTFTGHVLTTDSSKASAGCARILYAPSEPDDPAFREAVSAACGDATVDYFNASLGTPSVTTLSTYDCVFTWANYGYANKVLFGNNLADYVDAGGKVILGQFCYESNQLNWLEGRIMTPGYCPVTVSSGYATGSYAGDGTDCVHDGVTAYSTWYLDLASLLPGNESDGTFTPSGSLAVAWRPDRRVYYSPGNLVGYGSTGDWAQLVCNMCCCPPEPGQEPVFRYSVQLPEDAWFEQDANDGVYWFSVVAVYDDVPDYNWGWTNHEHVYNDNAVSGTLVGDVWQWDELYDQTETSEDMSFVLFTEPCLVVGRVVGGVLITPAMYDLWLQLGMPECWCYDCHSRGDTDGDCDVDTGDVTVAIAGWINYPDGVCADTDNDGDVDTGDITNLITGWINGCGPDCVPLP